MDLALADGPDQADMMVSDAVMPPTQALALVGSAAHREAGPAPRPSNARRGLADGGVSRLQPLQLWEPDMHSFAVQGVKFPSFDILTGVVWAALVYAAVQDGTYNDARGDPDNMHIGLGALLRSFLAWHPRCRSMCAGA